MTQDKVRLLMEETGCEQAEAELALSQSGWDVGKAAHALPSLLRNISLVKGRFHAQEGPLFGLLLVIYNRRSRSLVRARAVLSFNPSLWLADLDEEWFEFEKRLYSARLSEGSLQSQSLDLERRLAGTFSQSGFAAHPLLAGDAAAAAFLGELLALRGPVEARQKVELLSVAQIQLRRPADRAEAGEPAGGAGPFTVSVALDGDPAGQAAADLKAGDTVRVQVIDPRDVAQSMAALLGGRAAEGLRAISAPVESADPLEGGAVRVRVRLSPGVRGEAVIPGTLRLRTEERPPEDNWWKRLLPF